MDYVAGMARPLVKSVQINIRLTPEERDSLKRAAQDRGFTLSDFLVACGMEEVERVKKDQPQPANLGAGLGKSQGY